MKPRYEIHSLGMPEIVEPAGVAHAEQRDRAARALFAATEMVNPNKFETGNSAGPCRRRSTRSMPTATRRVSWRRCGDWRRSHPRVCAAPAADLTNWRPGEAAGAPGLRDAWGTNLQRRAAWGAGFYMVRSAGPDKRFDTGDDLIGYLRTISRQVIGRVEPTGSVIDLRIEHDRGPFNGLAEIAGSVRRCSGAAVPGRHRCGSRDLEREDAHGAIRTRAGQFSSPAFRRAIMKCRSLRPGFTIELAQSSRSSSATARCWRRLSTLGRRWSEVDRRRWTSRFGGGIGSAPRWRRGRWHGLWRQPAACARLRAPMAAVRRTGADVMNTAGTQLAAGVWRQS